MGNKQSAFTTNGARNFAKEARQEHDFYATDPKALELLLNEVTFDKNVWECACGQGHLAEVLKSHGYNVYATDLYDYGYGESGKDFLQCSDIFEGDIITNPPYKFAMEFVEKALSLIPKGHKVAMFLKIQFLEGKARRKLFEVSPPRTIYVSSGRLHCAINGDFERAKNSNAMAYAWFIWEKGYAGSPEIKWFN